jgi:hybrid polyketide synthase/nonribosomal peptide synthetase ACE1
MEPAEPIAIVGSACRFPGNVSSPSALWDLLVNPKDVVSPIPNDRFSSQGFYHKNGQYHGHTNVNKSYLLSGENNVRRFDAQFFGLPPLEANSLDPQVRLLLETVFEALEDGGQPMESLRGSETASVEFFSLIYLL